MEVKRLVVGMLGTNCYVISDNGHACVIDPGADAEYILSEVKDLKVDKIILTHGHFDHFMASDAIRNQTGAAVYISEKDAPKLSDYQKSLYDILRLGSNGFISAEADELLGRTIDICGNKFEVLETPGHSEGSVCLLCDKILISGDTLFRRSIGRYDRGNYNNLMDSLGTLMNLDDNITVLPGHGDATTIGQERKENPFLR